MGNPPGHRGARLCGTDDTEAVMKFVFDDESFSFEALRTAGFALYGGADRPPNRKASLLPCTDMSWTVTANSTAS